MSYRLLELSPEWIDRAPIRIARKFGLAAPPATVFATLVDHERWPTWFTRMRRVRVDGSSTGVGALRTVWVGVSSVQEHFVRWEVDRRLTFNITRSSLPGLRAMTEDWELIDNGNNSTTLRITIAVEPARLLTPVTKLIGAAVAHATTGAAGITNLFE